VTPARRLAVLALAAAAIGCVGEGRGSERIALRGPAWTLAGRSVTIDVTTAGALAERDVLLVVAVDSDVVGRFTTSGGRARAVVPAANLNAGGHEISVKSGSERSVLRVRVLPAAYPAAAAALLAAAALVAVVARRRRRSAGFTR
jgi:hypothetical protein